MKECKKRMKMATLLLTVFAAWTAAVCCVDVQAIGPLGSCVGFAGVNRFVHELSGVHMTLYTLTDWLGLIPAGVCMGFGLLGLLQWIKRRSFLKVDFSILVLGGFYIAVMACYGLFEVLVVNHRPVLIEGVLEASYPSSTTMLVLCVMLTALMQTNERIKNRVIRRCVAVLTLGFTAFMVIGRLISGVHWMTDIVGGMLLSAGLIALYDAVNHLK